MIDQSIAGQAGRPNVIDRISDGAGTFAGWLMVLAAFCIGYEIFSRSFFGTATVWVYDITTYALVWFSFIASSYVLKERRHLQVDLYINATRPRVTIGLELLGLVAVAAVSILIFYYSLHFTFEAYKRGELEPTIIRTPVYLIYAGMTAGLGILALQSFREILRAGREWANLPKERAGLSFTGNVWLNAVAIAILLSVGLYLLVLDYAATGVSLILMTLLFFGVPVFAALAVAGTIGIYFVFGASAGFPQTFQVGYKAVLSNTLLAIPLYVLAGNILQAGRIGPELFSFASAWIGHLRGGYAIATVAACAVFAAISGSSVATAATIGSMAIPEMLARGYDKRLVYGLVAAGGTLGILIPPSTPLILYSSMTNESTGALFMGGVVPGFLLFFFFAAYAIWASGPYREDPSSWVQRINATKKAIWGLLAPVIVLVGIYTGIFTPTEAAAVVVIYALVVSLVRRTVKFGDLPAIVADGVLISGMIMMIVVGALILGTVTTVLQFPQELQALVEDYQLSPWTVMVILVAIYIVLGMFLEVVSVLLITLPIVYPLVVSLGFDGLWFGIALVVLMELALITPPVGLNLFTVQGITRAPLSDIIRGVLPFICLLIVAFVLILIFPPLATWLPGTMGYGG